VQLEALEAQKATLTAQLAEPAFYQQDALLQRAELARMAALEAQIDAAFTRWVELEA